MTDNANSNGPVNADPRIIMPPGVNDPRKELPDVCACGAGPDRFRAALGGTVLCMSCGETLSKGARNG